MDKISKILVFLVLIFHVCLTITLPTHVLEERNLTVLLANRSGHELKNRDPFNPLKIKGTIFVRPANIPEQIRVLEITLACAQLRTFSDDFTKQHVLGPNLGKMFYEYRRSAYYNRMYFHGSGRDFAISISENILRPYDLTTDPFASEPSGPSKLRHKSTVKEFSLNAPGFSEFYEVLLQENAYIINYSRLLLLDIYRQVFKYLAKDTDINNYFKLIYKFGEKINSYLHKLTSLVDQNGS
ncbi:9419_t:CDS:2, partial [Gigaspora rosea]